MDSDEETSSIEYANRTFMKEGTVSIPSGVRKKSKAGKKAGCLFVDDYADVDDELSDMDTDDDDASVSNLIASNSDEEHEVLYPINQAVIFGTSSVDMETDSGSQNELDSCTVRSRGQQNNCDLQQTVRKKAIVVDAQVSSASKRRSENKCMKQRARSNAHNVESQEVLEDIRKKKNIAKLKRSRDNGNEQNNIERKRKENAERQRRKRNRPSTDLPQDRDLRKFHHELDAIMCLNACSCCGELKMQPCENKNDKLGIIKSDNAFFDVVNGPILSDRTVVDKNIWDVNLERIHNEEFPEQDSVDSIYTVAGAIDLYICYHCKDAIKHARIPKDFHRFPDLDPKYQDLNEMEIQLIRRVVPFVKVFQNFGSQSKTNEYSTTFILNSFEGIPDMLPHSHESHGITYVKLGQNLGKHKSGEVMEVRHDVVLDMLKYLQLHSSVYENVNIHYDWHHIDNVMECPAERVPNTDSNNFLPASFTKYLPEVMASPYKDNSCHIDCVLEIFYWDYKHRSHTFRVVQNSQDFDEDVGFINKLLHLRREMMDTPINSVTEYTKTHEKFVQKYHDILAEIRDYDDGSTVRRWLAPEQETDQTGDAMKTLSVVLAMYQMEAKHTCDICAQSELYALSLDDLNNDIQHTCINCNNPVIVNLPDLLSVLNFSFDEPLRLSSFQMYGKMYIPFAIIWKTGSPVYVPNEVSHFIVSINNTYVNANTEKQFVTIDGIMCESFYGTPTWNAKNGEHISHDGKTKIIAYCVIYKNDEAALDFSFSTDHVFEKTDSILNGNHGKADAPCASVFMDVDDDNITKQEMIAQALGRSENAPILQKDIIKTKSEHHRHD